MSDLKERLKKIQDLRQVAWETIELDYALSWILAALSEALTAQKHLIFKGGTCLKKCYFGEYRFSEDLDFTADAKLTDQILDKHLNEICQLASKIAQKHGAQIIFNFTPYIEKKSHPGNQRAYTIRAKYPWHRTALTKIKFEVTRDEIILFKTSFRNILHEYGEEINSKINTYAIEEILAEKYRGILQTQEKLARQSWLRSRVRDFYDLWHILHRYREHINIKNFNKKFDAKCQIKDITFRGPEQFFDNEAYLAKVHLDWERYLGNLVNSLPPFEKTIIDLRHLTNSVFEPC